MRGGCVECQTRADARMHGPFELVNGLLVDHAVHPSRGGGHSSAGHCSNMLSVALMPGVAVSSVLVVMHSPSRLA